MIVEINKNYFQVIDANEEEMRMLEMLAKLPTKAPNEIIQFGPNYPVYFLNQINYQINDLVTNEDPLPTQNDISLNVQYRSYQEEAIKSTIKSPRGYLELPTGSGKTIIMAGIIKQFGIPSTLIIAPSVDLCRQLRNRFQDLLNEWVGIYSHNFKEIRHITVCTFASFIQNLDKFKDFKMLLIDEAHHLTGFQLFSSVLVHPAIHKYGFSSTVEVDLLTAKYVRIALSGYFKNGVVIGGQLFKTRLNDIQEFFPKINIRLIPLDYEYKQLPEYVTENFSLYYKVAVSRNWKRNRVIAQHIAEIIKETYPSLILTAQYAHAEMLAKLLKDHLGYTIPIISSKMPKAEREAIIKAISDLKCAIATTIWDEGIDIPDLKCIIITSSQSSSIKAIQRVGRGLRKTENKDEILIVDFVDQCDPILYLRDKKRIRSYLRTLPVNAEELLNSF